MRILVSCIPYNHQQSGTAIYMQSVVNELKQMGHDLTILVEPGVQKYFPDFCCIQAPLWSKKPIFSIFYHLFIAPRLLKRSKFDCAMALAGNRRLFAFSSIPMLAVIHDLYQYHTSANFSAGKIFYLRYILPFIARRIKKFVAISHTTEEDLKKYWHIEQKKITINYNGLPLPKYSRSGWAKEHGLLHKEYILYISNLNHPGKNHLNLIEAYQQLPPGLIAKYPLILAGANLSEAKSIRKLADNSIARNQIRFTGALPDDCLADAYSHAAIYVFPSVAEGFGLPLIQAMHYGTACCVSNKGALKEIGEKAVELFDPENPSSITESLRRLLIDLDRREELQTFGIERAAKFSWRSHAEKLVSICAIE